eukprot:231706_1
MACGKSWYTLIERGLNSFIFAAFAISVIWLSYEYIKRRSIKNKCLDHMTLIFFTFILITNILWCIASALHCTSPNLWYIFLVSGFGFYGFQYLFLILLLFHRLCVVFQDSNLAVSITSKTTFYGGFVIFSILMIVGGVVEMSPTLHLVLTTIGLVITLIIIGLLVGLFIHKLNSLSRRVKSASDQSANTTATLLAVSTKTFVLTLVSIASFLLVGMISNAVFASLIGDEIQYEFVRSLVFALDLETNFLCILLGFQPFGVYYTKVFGRCQHKTVACFAHMVHKDHARTLASTQSVSAQSHNIEQMEDTVGTTTVDVTSTDATYTK